METEQFLIRMFDREKDYQMVEGWFDAHGKQRIPLAMLPKLGIVVQKNNEDAAALWLYMDNSVGVCFAETAVTKPKLSLKDSRKALHTGLDFLKKEAAALDYGVMLLRTYPAMARMAEGMGFVADERGLVSMSALTKV